MNVVMIMSGGVGKRFGGNIPKQYMKIDGKAVIDYVIERVRQSTNTDQIVIVMDKNYIPLSNYINEKDFIIASNGKERYDSINNGFSAIKENLNDVDKIVIVDAVAPLITGKLIDYYFELLDDYDCVITTQKITGALGNYNYDPLDREDYYITQSPEGFNYKLLLKYFNPLSKSQELAWQLPKASTKYLNFNFKNNLKITYNFHLDYVKYLLEQEAVNKSHIFDNISNKYFFVTEGVKEFLLTQYPEETNQWLDEVYLYYQELLNKYGPFKNVLLNQSSRYGIVFSVTGIDNHEFIVKKIPDFLNRYENEKMAYLHLSKEFMCPLLEYDDMNKSLILKRIVDATSAKFEDNIALTAFFDKVFQKKKDIGPISYSFSNFYKELQEKKESVKQCLYFSEEIEMLLQKAEKYYLEYFSDKKLSLIHGDLRMDNILKENDTYYAIDPIGYLAPDVFETSRFIIDDVDSNKNFNIKSRLNLLSTYFEKWFDKTEIEAACYIFTAFITYNSTFENQNSKQTENYIKICSILEENIKNHDKNKVILKKR